MLRTLLRRCRTITPFVVVSCAIACAESSPGTVRDAPLEVAVAANFLPVAESLVARLEDELGVAVRLSAGSSGSLYAQIRQGAPFEVFLSADSERPSRLESDGLAIEGSRTPYAIGRLVVFAPRFPDGWVLPDDLRREGVRVTWANPRIAPYGVAARAALEAWGLGGLEGAVGESVGQSYQFVASGAADAGFVARSQVLEAPLTSVREVPSDLHPAIVQEAVLLGPGEPRAEARAFLDALSEEWVRARIRDAGYEVPSGR